MQTLPIELQNETDLDKSIELDFYEEAEQRIHKLAEGHKDITGANIYVKQPSKGETSFIFEVTVTLQIRPNPIAATEKSDTARGALKGALDAVERQVREQRGKLRGH